MNDKILIGKKEKSDNGYVFTPYIKISELHLPIKFAGFDKNNQIIFVKTNDEKK